MNGYLHCARIDLNELLNKPCKIESVVISPDLGTFRFEDLINLVLKTSF